MRESVEDGCRRKSAEQRWRPGPCHKQRVGSFTASSPVWHEPDHRPATRPKTTRPISIGTAAYLVVDQAICQRLLESLVFHFRGYVQLLAIRGYAISASGFPTWALCHNG